MRTVPSNLPVATKAARPLPVTWWSQPLWIAAASLLGMAVSALFAGQLQLPRNLYLIFCFAIIGALLYAYVRWSGADVKQEFMRFWVWGPLGGAIAAFLVVQTTLWQPAPRSPMPQGFELLFDLVWLGLIYGVVDGLLLSVLPLYAAWQALTLLGWTARWPRPDGSRRSCPAREHAGDWSVPPGLPGVPQRLRTHDYGRRCRPEPVLSGDS